MDNFPFPIVYPPKAADQQPGQQPGSNINLTAANAFIKATRRQNYSVVTLALDDARVDEEQHIAGDFIMVLSLAGSCSVKLNERENGSLDLSLINNISTAFSRIFLSNSAQRGGSVTLLIGRDFGAGAPYSTTTSSSFSLASTTFVTVGVASGLVLDVNAAGRRYACFVNDSANKIYLSLQNAAVAGSGILLTANGGSFEINNNNLFTGKIYGIATGAGSNLAVTEGYGA